MTDLGRIIAEMRDYSAGPDCDSRIIDGWADRLAAFAGAAPVAWVAFGACTGEPVFSTTPPDDPNVAGWTPLFTHAPAKAREATDDVGDGMRYRVLRAANITWNGRRWPDPIELDKATSAALATFAEGE